LEEMLPEPDAACPHEFGAFLRLSVLGLLPIALEAICCAQSSRSAHDGDHDPTDQSFDVDTLPATNDTAH
jgi:hypothetical protein